MLEALSKSLGIVSTAAKKAGINRETHRLWVENDPEYAAAVADIKEDRKDFLESKLHQRVNEGSDTMIIFALKTIAKDRGYIERSEVKVTNDMEKLTDEELAARLKALEGDE